MKIVILYVKYNYTQYELIFNVSNQIQIYILYYFIF